ncbi:hypothetical protein AAFF_G00374990 [Aldrovandia affinis]|uniref:Uncharacterized protein n=1 Tax=Aldrovandia affinis TaxID=143900 RepID=A0AAD7SG83_9TELE|nr:hypothetical protein AAFF_G00374990 [Aldrovandia affinis]
MRAALLLMKRGIVGCGISLAVKLLEICVRARFSPATAPAGPSVPSLSPYRTPPPLGTQPWRVHGAQTGHCCHISGLPMGLRSLENAPLFHFQRLSGELKDVMDKIMKIINFVRGTSSTQHRLFRQLVSESLHNDVRWLSKGKVLERFCELLDQVVDFLRKSSS